MKKIVISFIASIALALGALAGNAATAQAATNKPVHNVAGYKIKVIKANGSSVTIKQGQSTTGTKVKVLRDYRVVKFQLRGSSYVFTMKCKPSNHYLYLDHNSHVSNISFHAYTSKNKNLPWAGNFLD
jgi:hypothetical protein